MSRAWSVVVSSGPTSCIFSYLGCLAPVLLVRQLLSSALDIWISSAGYFNPENMKTRGSRFDVLPVNQTVIRFFSDVVLFCG